MPKQARVYLEKSRVAHMVPVDSKGKVAADARCVRCGIRPRPWLTWKGAGTAFTRKREEAAARKLPLCKRAVREKD